MKTWTNATLDGHPTFGFVLRIAAVAMLTVAFAPLALVGLSFLAGGPLPMMILCAQLFTPTALASIMLAAFGSLALAGIGVAAGLAR